MYKNPITYLSFSGRQAIRGVTIPASAVVYSDPNPVRCPRQGMASIVKSSLQP